MFPPSNQSILCDNAIILHRCIPFWQYYRPKIVGFFQRSRTPHNTANMPHHDSIAIWITISIGGKTLLLHIKPLIGAFLFKDTTVGYSYPSGMIFKPVGVSYDRICISFAISEVASCNIIIGTVDTLTPYYTGIIGY